MSYGATMAILREQRIDRIAMAGIVAGLLSDLPDPLGRIREARAAAREFYLCKPTPNTKRTRHQREIIGRAASIFDEVLADVEQLAQRGLYPPSPGETEAS